MRFLCIEPTCASAMFDASMLHFNLATCGSLTTQLGAFSGFHGLTEPACDLQISLFVGGCDGAVRVHWHRKVWLMLMSLLRLAITYVQYATNTNFRFLQTAGGLLSVTKALHDLCVRQCMHQILAQVNEASTIS